MLRRRWPWFLTAAAAVAAAAALLLLNVRATACGPAVAAIGCAPRLAPAPGISVVTAYGRLTGRTTTVHGTIDHQMRLDHVVVLAGPARPATVYGWLATVPNPGPNLAAAQVPGLWAPDGRLLAHLAPRPDIAAEDSTIQVRPIVDGKVVFSAAACGGAPASTPTVPFTGPLAEVPGSRSYAVARCTGGFRAAHLDVIEQRLH